MPTTITSQSSYYDTLTLAEAKKTLRIYTQDFDREIEDVIASAIDYIEQHTGRTCRLEITAVDTFRRWCDVGRIEMQPASAISSLKYYDTNASLQTVSSANYRLIESTDGSAYLELDVDYVRPDLDNRDAAIELTYTAGYATADDLPKRLKQAVKAAVVMFWADLSPQEFDVWDRQLKLQLAMLDTGAYR